MKSILFSALTASVLTCFGQVEPPSTPAGKLLGEWLSAVNSGERAQVEAFQKSHAPDRPQFVDRTMGVVEQSGGFTLAAINRSEPRRITWNGKGTQSRRLPGL